MTRATDFFSKIRVNLILNYKLLLVKSGFVYIMSNQSRSTLYIGVTADLKKRMCEHKEGKGSVFTSKYKCYYLLYYEQHPTIEAAILRETQLKRWDREWKDELIKSMNPELEDLFDQLCKVY